MMHLLNCECTKPIDFESEQSININYVFVIVLCIVLKTKRPKGTGLAFVKKSEWEKVLDTYKCINNFQLVCGCDKRCSKQHERSLLKRIKWKVNLTRKSFFEVFE